MQAPSRSGFAQPVGAVVGGSSFDGSGGAAIITGSGLVVNGAYRDDNFAIGFHLGAQPYIVDDACRWWPGGANWCPPSWGWYYPNYWWSYGYYDYYDGYYDNSNQRYSVIDGALVVQIPVVNPTPAPAPTPPPPPPTDVELAAASLLAGDARSAIDSYRKHLQAEPEDADALRGLGIALLVEGQPDQGVAVLSMAYRTDPALADRAIRADTLFKSDGDLRRVLQRAVAFANKTQSGSSWLTVAALMQAEGRRSDALRMIERAGQRGLDSGVVKRFTTALGG